MAHSFGNKMLFIDIMHYQLLKNMLRCKDFSKLNIKIDDEVIYLRNTEMEDSILKACVVHCYIFEKNSTFQNISF